MTREEAISWLVSLTEHEGEDIPIYDNDVEALDMAISIMRKYQKIEQIISNFDESSNYYLTLEQIAKVVEDEND